MKTKSSILCGRNREGLINRLEEVETIATLSCLSTIVTTEIGVVMQTKIYHLLDEHGNIRNVGKTSRDLTLRLNEHIRDARSGTKNHRCNWIRSMLSKGLRPTIELQTEVSSDGCRAEIAYIAYYKKMGVNLTNGTDGGEGTTGLIPVNKGKTGLYHHTEETKRRIRDGGKGRIVSEATREKTRATLTGVPRPEDVKRKIREKLTGRRLPEEHCRHIGDSKRGRTQSEEHVARRVASRCWYRPTEETIKRARDSALKRHQREKLTHTESYKDQTRHKGKFV